MISPIISFIFGMSVGCIITFFTIIMFARTMEKKQRKLYIKMGKDKIKWVLKLFPG